jgi:hypothetical protein
MLACRFAAESGGEICVLADQDERLGLAVRRGGCR